MQTLINWHKTMQKYSNIPQMPSFTHDDGMLVDLKPILLQSKVPLGHAEVPEQQSTVSH